MKFNSRSQWLRFFSIILSFNLYWISNLLLQSSNLLAIDEIWIQGIDRNLSPLPIEKEIVERIHRVDLFKEINNLAETFHVRVWLSGGAASAYARYVTWDLQRENGDSRFLSSRFDYQASSIIRSLQDIDLVIDGDPKDAQNFLDRLQSIFPSQKFEGRALRNQFNKNIPLLSSDFLNQNSDSYSLGLIELSKPEESESVIRYARDWESKNGSLFLDDLKNATISYVSSENHFETSRHKEGNNPKIFSVIRYLIKVFQYGITIKRSDLKTLEDIIDVFDLSQLQTSYSEFWLHKHGPKLVQNSIDLERTFEILDYLKLLKKLIDPADLSRKDRISFWLSKQVLKATPINENTGQQTAGSMGLDRVNHETSEYWILENILGSPIGKVNAFISRQAVTTENAVSGNAFYTNLGTKLFFNSTGFSALFKLNPKAILNKDFSLPDGLSKENPRVLVTNANALLIMENPLKLEELLLNLSHDRLFSESHRTQVIMLGRQISGLSENKSNELKKWIQEQINAPTENIIKRLPFFFLVSDGRQIWIEFFKDLLKRNILKYDEVFQLWKEELVRGIAPDIQLLDAIFNLRKPAEFPDDLREFLSITQNLNDRQTENRMNSIEKISPWIAEKFKSPDQWANIRLLLPGEIAFMIFYQIYQQYPEVVESYFDFFLKTSNNFYVIQDLLKKHLKSIDHYQLFFDSWLDEGLDTYIPLSLGVKDALVEAWAYSQEQGLWRDKKRIIQYMKFEDLIVLTAHNDSKRALLSLALKKVKYWKKIHKILTNRLLKDCLSTPSISKVFKTHIDSLLKIGSPNDILNFLKQLRPGETITEEIELLFREKAAIHFSKKIFSISFLTPGIKQPDSLRFALTNIALKNWNQLPIRNIPSSDLVNWAIQMSRTDFALKTHSELIRRAKTLNEFFKAFLPAINRIEHKATANYQSEIQSLFDRNLYRMRGFKINSQSLIKALDSLIKDRRHHAITNSQLIKVCESLIPFAESTADFMAINRLLLRLEESDKNSVQNDRVRKILVNYSSHIVQTIKNKKSIPNLMKEITWLVPIMEFHRELYRAARNPSEAATALEYVFKSPSKEYREEMKKWIEDIISHQNFAIHPKIISALMIHLPTEKERIPLREIILNSNKNPKYFYLFFGSNESSLDLVGTDPFEDFILRNFSKILDRAPDAFTIYKSREMAKSIRVEAYLLKLAILKQPKNPSVIKLLQRWQKELSREFKLKKEEIALEKLLKENSGVKAFAHRCLESLKRIF